MKICDAVGAGGVKEGGQSPSLNAHSPGCPCLSLAGRFGVGCPESILMVVVSDYYKVFKRSVAPCQSFRVVWYEVLACCRAHTCSHCAPIQGVPDAPKAQAMSLSRTGQAGSVP